MAPLLLDSRDLLKLGLASIFTLVLIFATGYFLGHQRAAVFYQAGTEVQTLPLPEKNILLEEAVDSKIPEVIVAGEYIDVDHAEEVVNKDNASSALSVEHAKDALIDVLKNTTVESSNNEIRTVNPVVVQTVAAVDVNKLTEKQLSKIKYSVQVGMYGRLVNAENMVKILQAKKFDAYITDYTNKNDETRYNVRFGYFTSKTSASNKLKEFKEKQNGDGYLVKFSAENIVNVAEVNNINAMSNMPEVSDVIEKENNKEVQIPVSEPFDAVETDLQASIFHKPMY